MTQALVEAVKAHALANYESDGWDFVIETLEDTEIAEIIGDAATAEEAIARVGAEYKTLADYRDDIIAAGGEREKYEPDTYRAEPSPRPEYAPYVDQWQEHCDYEANARYDYISEAYGATALDAEYEAACDAEMEREEEERQAKLPFYERSDWLYMSDEEANKLAREAGYESAGECDDERLNRWAEMHSPGGDPAEMLPRPTTRHDARAWRDEAAQKAAGTYEIPF